MDYEPTTMPGGENSSVLRVRDQITLSFYWFALNLQSAALLPIVIPAQILVLVPSNTPGSAQQVVVLSWLSALGAVTSLLVQPIIGTMSDRTRGRFGRRRPYILVGTVLMLAGIAALGLIYQLSYFVFGYLLFNIGNNASTAAYQGMLPDRVPEDQRGAASGYLGMMTILGNVGSLALASLLVGAQQAGQNQNDAIRMGSGLFYALTSGVVLFGLIVTVFGIREVPLRVLPRGERNGADGGRLRGFYQRTLALWLDPWQNHNFTWVVLTRAFVMLGLSLFTTYILFYFGRVSNDPNFIQATAALAVLALVGAILSSLIMGIISDRVRRVPVVCVATAFMAVATVAFVVAPQKVPLWPLGVFFGLGYGAYTSVDWALAVDALPSLTAAGKDLGLWNIASTLPAVLAPLLGGLIITSADAFGLTDLGYRVVFAVASFSLLLGAAFVVQVRERRDDPPVEKDGGAAVRTSAEEPPHEPTPRRSRRRLGGWRLASGTRAGRAFGFLRFWPFYERLNRMFHPILPIPNAPRNLLLMRVERFHGKPITLPDGTHVESGDRVLVLHANNRLVAQLPPGRVPVRQVRDDLQALAAWTRTPGFPADVHAIYGFSLLTRAAPRVGFIVRDRRVTVRMRLERFFMLGLMALYHGKGLERLRQGTTFARYPQEMWMSIAELQRRFGL